MNEKNKFELNNLQKILLKYIIKLKVILEQKDDVINNQSIINCIKIYFQDLNSFDIEYRKLYDFTIIDIYSKISDKLFKN